MKKLLFIFLIFFFAVLPCAYSATYDVGVGGDYTTIAQVNAVAFDSGDIIQFNKGETFNDASLTLAGMIPTAGKNITIQAYGAGANPIFNGNDIRPIDLSGFANVTITDIDIHGFNDCGSACVKIRDLTGDLLIDGVDLDGTPTDVATSGTDFININGDGSLDVNIEVKNCVIDSLMLDTFANTVTSWAKIDSVAIMLWFPDTDNNKTAGTVKIHDNTISNIYTDAIHLAGVRTHGDGTYGTEIYNNTISNCGEGTLDLKHSRYVDVYNNNLSHNDYGVAGGTDGSYWGPALIESGFQAAAFSLDARDNRVRENYLHDSTFTGFASAGDNTLIYNNYFKDICNAINIQDPGVKVYNNIISVSTGKPDSTYGWNDTLTYDQIYIGAKLSAIRIDEVGVKTSGYIYNNTIYISSSVLLYGIAYLHTNNSGFEIENNIVQMTRNHASVFPFYTNSDAGTDPTVTHNNLYGAHANRVSWEGTVYDNTEQADWITAGHTGAKFADPEFTNPATPDFSLQVGAPGVGTGLATVCDDDDYKDGVSPSDSDYTDGFTTVDRKETGQCDMGAVVADTTAPTPDSYGPSGVQTFAATKVIYMNMDETTTCHWDADDVSYANMTDGTMDGVGSDHTDTVNVVEGVNTFYSRCMDTAGNMQEASTVIQFTVQEEETPSNPSPAGFATGISANFSTQ
jgi:parallel beta helix pectate lyase-like protein